ncbi:hypothetical protein [Paraburkholderia sp. MM5482-R1]|uniref:hypothetical protein n=1 Tax=unclassified Paraburkholderia TaxID=2615204 RepID=UPI003D1EE107
MGGNHKRHGERRFAERLLAIRRFRKEAQRGKKSFVIAVRLIKALDALFRHPATLLIAGFVLTAIVGTSIQQRQQDADKQRDEVVVARAAIARVQQALSEVESRGHLLSVRRHTAEAADLMDSFDEALIAANAALLSQSPVFERTINTPHLMQPLSGNTYELSEFLMTAGDPVPSMLKADYSPAEDRLTRYLHTVTRCVGGFVTSADYALNFVPKERFDQFIYMAFGSDLHFEKPGRELDPLVKCPVLVSPYERALVGRDFGDPQLTSEFEKMQKDMEHLTQSPKRPESRR